GPDAGAVARSRLNKAGGLAFVLVLDGGRRRCFCVCGSIEHVVCRGFDRRSACPPPQARRGERLAGRRTPLLPHVSRPVRSLLRVPFSRSQAGIYACYSAAELQYLLGVNPLRNASRRSRILGSLFLKAISDTV